jgi:hypothetical protein
MATDRYLFEALGVGSLLELNTQWVQAHAGTPALETAALLHRVPH